MVRWRPVPVLVLLGLVLIGSGCDSDDSAGPAGGASSTAPGLSGPQPPVQLDLAKGRSDPVADPVYPQHGHPAVDVLLYDLDLAWDPDTKTLDGRATLTVRAARPADEITLDFSGRLRAGDVTVDGTAVTETQSGDDITVPAPRPLAVDDQVVVVIPYRGKPVATAAPMVRTDIAVVGLVVDDDGSAFALQEPFGAFTWYPVNDHPSDEALYDLSVTVPEGWTAVSGGNPQPVGPPTAAGVTYRYVSAEPVASYLVPLGIDEYEHTVGDGPHGLPIHFWYRADEADLVLPQISQVSAMIAWLEARFGPYPFDTAGLMTIPVATGMETQTMITLAAGFPDEVMVHELAHHWFGDSVTPLDWSAMWLNEGWAMYAQALWQEQFGANFGQPSPLADTLAGWRTKDAELREEHGPPGDYKPGHFASPNVYYCPALMLHEIRKEIGDRAFFEMAKAWAQQHKNTNQDRASFTAFVNKVTGRDFTALIDAWLDSPTTPT